MLRDNVSIVNEGLKTPCQVGGPSSIKGAGKKPKKTLMNLGEIQRQPFQNLVENKR